MTAQLVAAGPLHGLEALAPFNRPAYASHTLIAATLGRRLGPEYAALFARPEVTGEEVKWWTDLPGPVRRWSDLPADARAKLDAGRLRLGGEIGQLIASLGRAGINTSDGNLAHILSGAAEIPGREHIYAVGDQPVLAFWGFRRTGGASVNALAPLAAAGAAPEVAALRAPVVPGGRSIWPWLAALLLLALVAVSALWWWHPRRESRAPIAEQPTAPAPPIPTPTAPTKLVLPQNLTDKSLGFLEGLWRARTELYWGNAMRRIPIDVFYRMGANGRGEIFIRRPDGSYCKGPARASAGKPNVLDFQVPNPPVCPDGTTINAFTLNCSRLPDGAASCEGVNIPDDVSFAAEFERADHLP